VMVVEQPAIESGVAHCRLNLSDIHAADFTLGQKRSSDLGAS